MRIQKSRMRWGRSEIAQGVDQWIGIFLAIVICFFALQQGYGVQNMHDITQAEPDHLAVHTMERQQGSFLDILGRSELTQSEQARLTVSARITRLNAERNVIFVGRTCKRICRECYPDLSGILPYRKHICAQPCVDHGIHTLAGWGKSF